MTRPGAVWSACLLAALLVSFSFLVSLSSAQGVADAPPERVRVAVLDFENLSTLDPHAVSYLADVVRSEARLALPPEQSIVMTRDSILELLPPGTRLSECVGDCAVETGRRLGAHYVVTGQVVHFGGELRVILSLYATEEANLLVMRRVGGADPLELEAAVTTAAAAVFATLPIAVATEQPGVFRTVELEVITDPPGADVRIDGEPHSHATPCMVDVDPGTHELALDLADHEPWIETLHVSASVGRLRLERALTPEFGVLDVISTPPDLAVVVDDRSIGRTPIHRWPLRPGPHTVRIVDPRYHEMGDHLVMSSGEARILEFTPSAREGYLAVRARDEDGDSISAMVTVDGRRLGHAPDRFTLLVGRYGVEIEHANGRWSGTVQIEENAVETLDVELETTSAKKSQSFNRLGFDLAFDATTDPEPDLPLYQDFTWGFSASLWLRRSRSIQFGLLYGALSSGNHHVAGDDENQEPRPFLFHRVGLGLKWHLIGNPSIYIHAFGAMGFGQVALGAEAVNDPPEAPDLYLPADIAPGTWIYGWGFGWEPGYGGRDDGGPSLFLEVGFNRVDMKLEYDDQLVWKQDGTVVYGPRVTGEYEQFYRYTHWRIGLVFR